MFENKAIAKDMIDIFLSDIMQRDAIDYPHACVDLSSNVHSLQNQCGTMLLPIAERILLAIAKEHGWKFIHDTIYELEDSY